MVKVDDYLAVLGNLEKPLCAVISAGRCVEDMLSVKFDEHERLYATRKGERRDASQHGALNDGLRYHVRLVNVLDHLNGERICNPGVTVRILEVDRRVEYGTRHIAKVDVQHMMLTAFLWTQINQ